MTDLISKDEAWRAVRDVICSQDWTDCDGDFFCDTIERAIRELPDAPGVKVKPLEWEHGHKFCGQECSYAETEFGAWMMVAYSGRGGRWAHTDPEGYDSDDDWETRDECQAAANADYQARILSALEGSDT